jgi:hypothetical protein
VWLVTGGGAAGAALAGGMWFRLRRAKPR